MSAGALVSFMLYQQSLSGAFSMMGDVFSALTAAVGAADKVRAVVVVHEHAHWHELSMSSPGLSMAITEPILH